MRAFRFEALTLTPEAEAMRVRVRAFLRRELENKTYRPHTVSWITFDDGFTRRAAEAGFVGMAWPQQYGGHGRTHLERFVVNEEMLQASAPAGAHWIADRQSGPQIFKYGSERAKQMILPKIAQGECFFGIGMSEPGAGSDLAAVRTRADKVDGGWKLNGSKIWTSNAHRVHYIIALVRTSPPSENRHEGFSQFIIDMTSPGLDIRPILNLAGRHEFNEVFFDDCFVPDDMMIGQPGDGWRHVTGELVYERAGPDRFMSNVQLLRDLIDRAGPNAGEREQVEIGRLVAHLTALRRMSASVAGLVDRGESPATEAAVIKDMGTAFEREVPEVARRLAPVEADIDDDDDPFAQGMAHVLLQAPSYTIRGGVPEVLRSMIARGLGLR